jgi:hypothetical protein
MLRNAKALDKSPNVKAVILPLGLFLLCIMHLSTLGV